MGPLHHAQLFNAWFVAQPVCNIQYNNIWTTDSPVQDADAGSATDLLWFVLKAQHPRGLLIAGGDSEPVLPVIGSTGIVACPSMSKTSFASIDQVHAQIHALCTSQSVVEPSAAVHCVTLQYSWHATKQKLLA